MKSTKDLARELGLIRKRTFSNPSFLSRCVSEDQPFSYLVVIDFESTCWEDSKFRTQEIIEFPAVLLNTKTGEVEDEFRHYVMPQEQPVLSQFCTKLTGITQSEVEAGIPIRLCLKKFCHWLDKINTERSVVFPPHRTGHVPATFVTWSDWDLGVCLQNECRRKQLLKPVQLNSWIDLRATYTKFYDRKPNGLHGALQGLGIEFEGRQHSGLDDAKNTAKLSWRMIQDGCKLNITKTIKGSPVNQTVTAHLALAPAPKYGKSKQNFTPPKAKRRRSGTRKTPTHESDTVKNTTCFELLKEKELSCRTFNAKSLPSEFVKKLTSTKINLNLKQISVKIFCDSSAIDSKASETSGITTNSCARKNGNMSDGGITKGVLGLSAHNNTRSVYKHTNVHNSRDIGPKLQISDPQTIAIKAPIMLENACLGTDSTLKSLDAKPHVSNNTTHKLNACTSNSVQTSKNKSSFKTPVNGSVSNTMKVTPPMCQCGRRSKRRIVQSPGPNFGRFFFTCCRKQRDCNDENKGCNFFKWEENKKAPCLPRNNRSFTVEHSKCLITPVQSKSFSVASVYKPFTPVVTEHISAMSNPLKKSLGMKSTFLRL